MSYTPIRLQPGTEIDGFVLGERLHRGGMATLWSVTRADLAVPAVMKVPILGRDHTATNIVGFEVEQMIMPKLAGPHVPRFIAKGDFTSQPYIVMERLPGTSLHPRLEALPLPVEEIRAIGIRVAHALHEIHRQHVVHLDVKPSNIMFRPDGDAVFVDFGLSRHELLPDLLAEEFLLPIGTGPYMSPEQIRFLRDDPRSDLFALGVMLYYFATGTRPFGEPNTRPGLRRRLYQAPTPPRMLRKSIPEWLQEVILRCLEADPEARYQSAAQLAFDLQNPEDIPLTERALRREQPGWAQSAKSWLRAIGSPAEGQPSATEQLARAPIIAVAVDLYGTSPELRDALRRTVRRIMQTEADARLACLTVRRTARIGMDAPLDAAGRNVHVKHLVGLKQWARSLALNGRRISHHVLEGSDLAAAILQYAQTNQVDHLIIGARGNSALRRYLGSVSAKVVTRAACTVTVVRAPGRQEPAGNREADPNEPRNGPAGGDPARDG